MKKTLLLIIVLSVLSSVVLGQNRTIAIEMPIPGNFIYITGDGLSNLNTQTGDIQQIIETSKSISSLFWDNKALFYSVAGDVFRYDFDTSSSSLQFIFLDDATVYDFLEPYNDDHFAYMRTLDRFNPYAIDEFSIEVYDTASKTYQILFSIRSEEITTTLPLPAPMRRFRYQKMRAIQNPVYKNWFMIDFPDGTDPDDLSSFDGVEMHENDASLLFLWNSETGTFISLDQLLQTDGKTIKLRSTGWNPNGDTIAVSASNGLISLIDVNANTKQVSIRAQAPAIDKLVRHWLGIDDILIVASSRPSISSPSFDTDLSLAKIVDGTLYEKPFLTFQQRDLNRASLETAWQLTANDSERHELSCLFDQALPTQLMAGRSTVTTASLVLMDEPNADSNQLASLLPQTFLTLTSEKACTDNVRWQHVTLSDGTNGWVMEADRTHYYLGQG